MDYLKYSSDEMFSSTELIRKSKVVFEKLSQKDIEKAVILRDGKPSFIMLDFVVYEKLMKQYLKAITMEDKKSQILEETKPKEIQKKKNFIKTPDLEEMNKLANKLNKNDLDEIKVLSDEVNEQNLQDIITQSEILADDEIEFEDLTINIEDDSDVIANNIELDSSVSNEYVDEENLNVVDENIEYDSVNFNEVQEDINNNQTNDDVKQYDNANETNIYTNEEQIDEPIQENDVAQYEQIAQSLDNEEYKEDEYSEENKNEHEQIIEEQILQTQDTNEENQNVEEEMDEDIEEEIKKLDEQKDDINYKKRKALEDFWG